MKKALKILSVLVVLALMIASVFFYSIYISVDRVKLNYTTLSSAKIPEEMNDIRIAYVTDIKYGSFMTKDRLTKMINKLNEAGCDIVLFGGDMFLEPATNAPDSDAAGAVTEILKSIDAPLGKFAVLGDQDLVNEETKTLVSNVLYNANFEIITNTSVRIRNHSNASIDLIGLDSLINGNPDEAAAFSTISENEFNIVLTHCPDMITKANFNTNYTDVMLSGHSLGGQIYLPLIGPMRTIEGAKKYPHGTYTINNTKLFVSNGLGTEGIDMRLFAPPEILMFRLQHTTTQS